jgi:hypothetical protein
MGFKCSLLGHEYGETEVERDREQQGSEVVITVRETERCRRCGRERVVSENKEVTTVETPDGVDLDDGSDDDDADAEPEPAAAGVAGGASPETEVDAGGAGAEAGVDADGGADDAEIIDAGPDESADDELAAPSIAEAEATVGTESEVDADADGPAVDVADEPAGADGGGDVVEPGEDAVILDADDDGDEEAGRAPGEWPEEPEDDGPAWTPDTSPAETEIEPTTGGGVTVPEGEFRCPDCGFGTDVDSSSLRAGDFCPECRTGTLEHRVD